MRDIAETDGHYDSPTAVLAWKGGNAMLMLGDLIGARLKQSVINVFTAITPC